MALPASNGKTILITGINGYIASVLGQLLLSKGYSIRGTTRRTVASDPLLKGPYALYKERIQIYEVPDMTSTGAFDEAAKGVHGIFHVASPVSFVLDSYEATVVPAMRGTETVLKAASKAGPQLSSVVVTSSVAAVTNYPVKAGYIFTEKDFAHVALDIATENKAEGIKTPAGILYSASKTAAERTVWKYREEHKPPFAISTVNPSVVIGPPIIMPDSGSKLNETLLPIYKILSGSVSEMPAQIGGGAYVDVRDVAKVHLWAFENSEKANGERYIAATSYGPPQGVADILRYKYRGTKIAEKIIVGNPGEGYIGYNKETGEVSQPDYLPESPRPSAKKAQESIGLTWIPFKQSVIETAGVLEALL
ncbi:hypothetical protein V501_00629 [Pseudogymnoascus sp. VKM F-4519 (FW-2642)]|nr:hypothetical protein V501_00629 [Pseudogymnoascus sp. VKM F-4519 (FW-2642)]